MVVVLLHGARQTGKTTLVRFLAASEHPARYLTLDDVTVLAAASADPAAFIAGLDGPVIIDEVHVAASDFSGLRYLATLVGKRFRRGIVLYDGTDVVPFGNNLVALPVSSLWTLGSSPSPTRYSSHSLTRPRGDA